MIPVVWMTASAVGSCLVAVALSGEAAALWGGMLAPLGATVATWLAVEAQLRRDPAGVHALLLRGFAAKVVFFGVYVFLALEVLRLEPTPFILSFTVYFISLYCAEALGFARLFVAGLRQAR
jgi:hypothetical protein